MQKNSKQIIFFQSLMSRPYNDHWRKEQNHKKGNAKEQHAMHI